MVAGKTLGAHSEQEMNKFYEDLNHYVDETGRTLGIATLDFRVTSGPGDARDLLTYLQK